MSSGRLIDYLGSGVAVDRPTPVIPLDGIAFWLETDTSILAIWDPTAAAWTDLDFTALGSLVSAFIQLSDVPASYTGEALKLVRVNASEDELEFVAPPTVVTQEIVEDWVAALVTNGAGITVTYDDGLGILAIACTISQYTDEMARDALGLALVAGTGITVTPNDGADQITIATTITQYTDEMARDAVGATFVAGVGISIVVDDGADTATISTALTVTDDTGGAGRTLALADSGDYIRMSDASPNNVTVPTNASVAFPVGTQIYIAQVGAGQTTIVAAGGVTINTPATLLLRTQFSSATLTKVATNTWDLVGDLEPL